MLKNRRKFPPGGFQFTQVQTNWKAKGFNGFENVVMQIYNHRLANPQACEAFKLSTDMGDIRAELDAYNCARLNHDPAWCVPDPPPPEGVSPKSLRPYSPGVGAAVAGETKKIAGAISLFVDWIGEGGKPVAQELAEARAKTCAACPLNKSGNFMAIFIKPVADAIRATLEIKNHLKLQTSLDEKLLICHGCDCVLSLKVWTPLKHILDHIDPAVLDKLDQNCWVLHGQ